MICKHLQPIEAELIHLGIAETFRGQAWTKNCREWVYFDCYLDLASLRKRLALDPCVVDHTNDDPRSGCERGLVCNIHWDAIVGSFAQEDCIVR